MNRYLSTMGLYARANLYRVLLIILATALAASLLIWRYPSGTEVLGQTFNPTTGEYVDIIGSLPDLNGVAGSSGATIACGVGYGLVVVAMCLTGCGYGVKTDYTVRRLRISERKGFLLWAAYHAVLLLFFWAVLAAALYGMLLLRCHSIAAPDGSVYGAQTMLLLCYTDTFLHQLIPLRDVAVWGLRAASVAATAMGTVHFSTCQRHGKFSVLVLFVAAGTVASFFCPLGSNWNLLLLFILLGLACVPLVSLFGGEEYVD